MNAIRITRLWDMSVTPARIHEAWFLLEVAINETHIAAAREAHPADFWDASPAEFHVAAAEDVYAVLESAHHFEALEYWEEKGYSTFLFPVDCCEIIPHLPSSEEPT